VFAAASLRWRLRGDTRTARAAAGSAAVVSRPSSHARSSATRGETPLAAATASSSSPARVSRAPSQAAALARSSNTLTVYGASWTEKNPATVAPAIPDGRTIASRRTWRPSATKLVRTYSTSNPNAAGSPASSRRASTSEPCGSAGAPSSIAIAGNSRRRSSAVGRPQIANPHRSSRAQNATVRRPTRYDPAGSSR